MSDRDRPVIAWDTETCLFRPGLKAPPLVCVTWCTIMGGQISAPSIINYWDASRWAHEALDSGALLVGQNVSYDMAVLGAHDASLVPKIFKAYRENRVTDTKWRQVLADIGRGKYRGFVAPGGAWVQLNYDLGSLAKRHGCAADKDDPWRRNYELLREIPVAEWPAHRFDVDVEVGKGKSKKLERRVIEGADAAPYALNDAMTTARVYLGQEQRYSPELLCNQYDQARHFWALDLASTWGLRTSPAGVRALEEGTREHLEHLQGFLQEVGLVKPDGVRDTKAAKARMIALCEASGAPLRRTEPSKKLPEGDVCLDNDACHSVGDPVLAAYAEFSSYKKVLSSDVKQLAAGIYTPVHTTFGMADSGRKTSSKPNVQNPRRLQGVRECYVPRGFAG